MSALNMDDEALLRRFFFSFWNNRNRYAFLLGAGCSLSAGVPLATADTPSANGGKLLSIASQAKKRYYQQYNPDQPADQATVELWFKEQGLLQDLSTLYADALSLLSFTPYERRSWLEQFFEGKRPSEGHIALARLVAEGFIKVIFTTNFDPLIEDALRDAGLRPIVVAHDQAITTADMGSDRPKVIKLHGDYLFSNLKNLDSETRRLKTNMRENFENVLSRHGLVVVGYGGNDRSIMEPLKAAISRPGHLPFGVRWMLHINDTVPVSVARWREANSELIEVIKIDGSDWFFTRLRDELVVQLLKGGHSGAPGTLNLRDVHLLEVNRLRELALDMTLKDEWELPRADFEAALEEQNVTDPTLKLQSMVERSHLILLHSDAVAFQTPWLQLRLAGGAVTDVSSALLPKVVAESHESPAAEIPYQAVRYAFHAASDPMRLLNKLTVELKNILDDSEQEGKLEPPNIWAKRLASVRRCIDAFPQLEAQQRTEFEQRLNTLWNTVLERTR